MTMIKSGDKQLVVYNDDYKPVNVYGNRKKIAGYKEVELSGKHIEVEDTYNDVLDVKVQGHHEQDNRKAYWWNQMIDLTLTSYTHNGVTFTRDGNYVVANGTATGNNATYRPIVHNESIYIVGHKYFLRGCPSGGSGKTYRFQDSSFNSAFDYGDGCIFTPTKKECNLSIVIINGYTAVNVRFSPQLFDLTAMFGEGKEPTAEQFRKMFPCDYYPYCAGEWRYANGGQYVNFNQLAINGNFNNGLNNWGYSNCSAEILPNGSIKFENSENYVKTSSWQIWRIKSFYKGRKYLVTLDSKRPSNVNAQFLVYFRRVNTTGYDSSSISYASSERQQKSVIVNTTDDCNRIIIYPNMVVRDSSIIYSIQIFDLTQMFGEGNEPTTVEEFEALYPNEYYEYVESRYEYTPGYYENGQVVEHIPDTAFDTPFPEMPEEIRAVDSPKIEIGSTKAPTRFIPTTTEIPFKLYGANGINDTCEPCVLVDGEWKCRVTRRWGSVDMGELMWENSKLDNVPSFLTSIPNKYRNTDHLCTSYKNNEYLAFDKTFTWNRGSEALVWLRDDDVQSLDELVNKIKGQFIVYKLKTPIIELYDPIPIRTLPINSIINCDAEMVANVKVVDKEL